MSLTEKLKDGASRAAKRMMDGAFRASAPGQVRKMISEGKDAKRKAEQGSRDVERNLSKKRKEIQADRVSSRRMMKRNPKRQLMMDSTYTPSEPQEPKRELKMEQRKLPVKKSY